MRTGRPRTNTIHLPAGPGADLAHALARNVHAHRLAQGLSQKQLAERAGLNWRSVARVEGPEVIADLNTLALLAIGLTTSPSALIL